MKHTGKKKLAYGISVVKPERLVYLDVLGIDGRELLKCI